MLFGILLKDLMHFGVDDSYIFYRYAENLSVGNGFVFNAGEPAGEGFTSWIWLLLLAFFKLFGLDVILISKTLGVLFHLFSAYIIYCIVRQITPKEPGSVSMITAILSAAAYLSSYQLVAHTVSGMETSLYIFSLLLLIYFTSRALLDMFFDNKHWFTVGLAALFVFLVRPEGIAAGGISLIALAVKRPKDLLSIKTYGIISSVLIIPFALFILMKVAVFGYPLPQSFYHKFIIVSTEYGKAWQEYLEFIREYAWLIFPALTASIITAYQYKQYVYYYFPVLFLAMTTLYLLFYPVMNYLHRFYIPYIPLLLIGVSPYIYMIVDTCSRFSRIPLRIGAILLLFVAMIFGINWNIAKSREIVYSWSKHVNPSISRTRMGIIMSQLPRQVTIANSEMGVIPYYSRLTCIDMVGLTDPYIAHHGMSIEYLTRRHVDIIVFPRNIANVAPNEWDSFGLNYKTIFLSPKFKRDFECIGAYIGPDKKGMKYYFYVDRTSLHYDNIIKWEKTFSGEMSEH